jgi:hypothetical protein
LFGGLIFTDNEYKDWKKEIKNVLAKKNWPIDGLHEEGKYM